MSSNDYIYRRDSFSHRICDDLCQYIVQYLSVEERDRLQCVSKQFQRTVFAPKIRLVIDLEYDLKKRGFFERFRHILKNFPNIEIIRIKGDIKRVHRKDVKILFDGIHYFCNNSTKFELRVESLSKELMQRFFEKFGSNIIQIKLFEGIPKVLASKESNVEKVIVKNEIQFKRLKYFQIGMFNTQDLDPLEVFIERNKQNIKHLDLFTERLTDEEKTKPLNIISNLSNLVELRLRIGFDFNDKRIAKHLTRIANNCKELKSIEIWFDIYSKTSEDWNDLMEPFRQFKRLRRLRVEFKSFDRIKTIDKQLFSFKVFKGFENITHLSIGFCRYSQPFCERILTDIDINLPKLQYFKFDNRLVPKVSPFNILSRLSKLKKIDLKISGKMSETELKSKLIEKCKRIQNICLFTSKKKIDSHYNTTSFPIYSENFNYSSPSSSDWESFSD